jgi:hypothetical protein
MPVGTTSDWKTYTHILYLDNLAGIVIQRCRDDVERHVPSCLWSM